MKKHILALAVALTALTAYADNLNTEQLKLRRDVITELTSNGYTHRIDSNGDVLFSKDGVDYRVKVSGNMSNPYLISVVSTYPYNNATGLTKANIEPLTSSVNQAKTVKLICDNNGYSLRSDILCDDIAAFNAGFNKIIADQQAAAKQLNEFINSGFGGMDLTGNLTSIYNKAVGLYSSGEDDRKAFNLLKYLADSGYSEAYGLVGSMYLNAIGTTKDNGEALKWFDKAIETGHPEYNYFAGVLFYNNQDYPKALEYFNLGSASDNSFRGNSYEKIGELNEKGLGIPQNRSKAIHNYKKALEFSKKLDSDARKSLMRLGEEVERKADFKDLPKSLTQGLTAQQLYDKGNDFENGRNNVYVSLPKAYGYFKAAADRDMAQAQLKMGEIYLNQYYPFRDKKESDKYYKKALKSLENKASYDSEANYTLGMMYKNGLGVEKDSEKSLNYLKTAALKGNANANYEMGLYFKGLGEPVDAFKYFLAAAEKGQPDAMYEVAYAYETGLGAARSNAKAIEWYTRCADSTSAFASKAAQALKHLGTVDDDKE